MAQVIEEAIRYPGFAIVNVQSPCVTYGEEEQQIKAHRGRMKALAKQGHDPADRMKAIELAAQYGVELHTGVFYRNPAPPPTYEAQLRKRQARLQGGPSRSQVFDLFVQK